MILRVRPHVLCAQEVDHWASLEEDLAGAGYRGVFKKRTGDRKIDGCAIMWDTERYRGAASRTRPPLPHTSRARAPAAWSCWSGAVWS